jgi:LPPG:FO 2-phospho-L-lactate transferase
MKITALAGGVGGAKLSQGLSEVLPVDDLTIIVNTGDDFTFYGLYICPDLDTVSYTLAGMANPKTGWGVIDETFNTFEMLKDNHSPDWFMLGDKDLATHMERTRMLDEGRSLTEVSLHFNEIWNIKHPILPMCDQPVPTMVETVEEGWLSFQEYFVKYHFQPQVKQFVFKDIDKSRPDPAVLSALREADAVVICPSNPFVSIAPILAVPGIRETLNDKFVLAVSPIIGGKAVKGPLGKIFEEKGIQPSPLSIVQQYADFLDCIYLDSQDESYGEEIKQSGIIFEATDIMMPDLENRTRLAQDIIKFIEDRQRQ